MILGSHNSWSYLPPKHWWLRPFAFIAKCQSVDIKTQYEKYGVRCFDLRILFDKKGNLSVAHGFMKYEYTPHQLMEDLRWLNEKGCYVRVLHEIRHKKQFTDSNLRKFTTYCSSLEQSYSNIRFWCGRNLYNWKINYKFKNEDPICDERYSSVCSPRIIDDWWPWIYAKTHNRRNLKKGSSGILLIDFVNIR